MRAKSPSYNAEGFSGYTTGPTTMITGEAGTEHVTVIKNPRQVDLAAAGGQGGEITLTINIDCRNSLVDPQQVDRAVRDSDLHPAIQRLKDLRHGPRYN